MELQSRTTEYKSTDCQDIWFGFCVISHFLFNILVFPGAVMFSAASINKKVTV